MSRPTPGPWEAGTRTVTAPETEGRLGMSLTLHGGNVDDNRANARLIAEAGTVYHETGLTPRQLAEQRAELLSVVDRLCKQFYAAGIGYLKNSDDPAEKLHYMARAAIAKAKGQGTDNDK